LKKKKKSKKNVTHLFQTISITIQQHETKNKTYEKLRVCSLFTRGSDTSAKAKQNMKNSLCMQTALDIFNHTTLGWHTGVSGQSTKLPWALAASRVGLACS